MSIRPCFLCPINYEAFLHADRRKLFYRSNYEGIEQGAFHSHARALLTGINICNNVLMREGGRQFIERGGEISKVHTEAPGEILREMRSRFLSYHSLQSIAFCIHRKLLLLYHIVPGVAGR